MCGNRQELLQVYLGCGWIGAVTVPINTASRGAQLAHVLTNSQAKLLVLQAEFAHAIIHRVQMKKHSAPQSSLRYGLRPGAPAIHR